MNTSDGPVVVHCSAGVGRTGVFLAVHKEVARIKRQQAESSNKPFVNIAKLVVAMREQRTGMVRRIHCGSLEERKKEIEKERKTKKEREDFFKLEDFVFFYLDSNI